MRRALVSTIGSLALLAVAACKGGAPVNETQSASESPQATAEPAPLANVPMPATSVQPIVLNSEAGPPAVVMRGDLVVPIDSVSAKESAGWTLQAALRTGELPAAMKGPESNSAAIDAARKKTEPRLSIDLTYAHARIVLESPGFTLPENTELRLRADYYGAIVLLPGAPVYRVAAPGTLRSLLGDRRIDVAPLAAADVNARGDGAHRLGYRTRKVEATNRAATATFEIAHVADVGEGGALVCRALLDLMNAPPSTVVCGTDDVPLHVELRWTSHGAITFDVTALAHRIDLTPQLLAAPPPTLAFALPALPFVSTQPLVTQAELAAFRTGPETPPAANPSHAEPAPGLTLANSTDALRFAWLDGVPVAWLAPGARLALPTLDRGRYTLAWRTFLGDLIDPAQTINVPGASDLGATDAGAAK